LSFVDPVRTILYPDPNDKSVVAVSYQDYSHVLEQNKVLRDVPQKRAAWARHIAQVPNNLIFEGLNEEWRRGNTKLKLGKEFNETVVRKKLADPNYSYLLV
jgi:hypothetical protein